MHLLINNLINLTKSNIKFNKSTLFCLIQQRNYCIPLGKHGETSQQSNVKPQKEQKGQEQKTLSVAVIGVPNVGKSTFINNLINHRVSR